MKRKIYILFIVLILSTVSSCNLDLQNDPNSVTADTASLNLVLNGIQLDFVSFFHATSFNGRRLTRMINQNGDLYETVYVPNAFDGFWINAYSNVLNNIKFLEPLAEDANFRRHLGIARVIKAYVLMTMVDYFDAIPYSQALDPSNFNPILDPGPQVYAAAFEALRLARTDFSASSLGFPEDFFYRGNYENWVKLINSLELKYHLNRKLIDPAGSTAAINALISANNFIQPGQEFIFRYATNLTDPDSRHPNFAGQYQPGGGGDYQSTWYMFNMTEAKGIDDPRARFYFYRQQLVNPTNAQELRCLGEFAPAHYQAGGFPFCLPGNKGYWGRDHLNNEGIPPDGLKRTAYGVFPAGGRFDDNSAESISPTAGAGGAGIQPIMLPSYIDFMLAEAALTLTGVNGDPKALLLSGITKSMTYVRAFSTSTSQAGVINNFQSLADFNAKVISYNQFITNEYDVAASNRKMHIIGREYWLALFGNGNESVNLYRRTGQPDGMQPGLFVNFGDFPRSFFYPNVVVTTNFEISQKTSQKQRVFWDTNPEGNGWVN